MAHDHDHHHGESYYLDQLCTVAACGFLAGISLLMWQTNLLFEDKFKNRLLADQFKVPVLLGALAILVVVIVRAVTLWIQVGKKKAAAAVPSHGHAHAAVDHHHDHTHDHDHEHCDHKNHEHCDHDHGNHDHDHGHNHDHHSHDHGHDHDHNHDHGHDHSHDHAHGHDGHDHGFAPWRYAVLLLPLMLASLLLYYHYQGLEIAYSKDRLNIVLGRTEQIEAGGDVVSKDETIPLRFDELTVAAALPAKRNYYEGYQGKLKGKLMPYNDREFTLYRMKMTCCVADAVPLKVRIISSEPLPADLAQGDWVDVSGQIQFRKIVGKNEFLPVLLTSPAQVKKTTATTSVFEQ